MTARHPEADAPSPDAWPTAPPQSAEGRLFTELIITTFRLNARLLEEAQTLAAAGGITAAWWQVLGGVLDRPRSVADIGRRMGMTRQAVQRVADILVDRRLARYEPNPAHRRAKLLACSDAGYFAIRQITVVQHPWSDRVGQRIGAEKLRTMIDTSRQILRALEPTDTGS